MISGSKEAGDAFAACAESKDMSAGEVCVPLFRSDSVVVMDNGNFSLTCPKKTSPSYAMLRLLPISLRGVGFVY
jgi:hypothetical protein